MLQHDVESAGHAEQYLFQNQDAAQGQQGGAAVPALRAPHQEWGGAWGLDGAGSHVQ